MKIDLDIDFTLSQFDLKVHFKQSTSKKFKIEISQRADVILIAVQCYQSVD